MSRFAIAPTDLGWFARLRDGVPLQAVNFWTPTSWNVRGLGTGDRLYFMLKSPIRKIGGYGEFVRYTDMSASAAWDAYGIGNGVADRAELVARITHFALHRAQTFKPSDNPTIGCIELKNPVMLDDSEFLVPEQCGHSFPRQVVKLKYFDEPDGIAKKIGTAIAVGPFALVTGNPERAMTTRKDRKGQSVFRQSLLSRYGYRCCITGEKVGEILEAAHIQPYVNGEFNHVQNGLCLRVDLHRLFDAGLITIAPDNRIEVSVRLKGTTYEQLRGEAIKLPELDVDCPSDAALAFHRSNVFR